MQASVAPPRTGDAGICQGSPNGMKHRIISSTGAGVVPTFFHTPLSGPQELFGFRDAHNADYTSGYGLEQMPCHGGHSKWGHPLAKLRRFAAEQQEVTWYQVRFGVWLWVQVRF